MKKHGEVNKIFDGGNIRDWSGDRRDAMAKERELLASLRDGDIPIDRIFIVDDVQIPPLRTGGGLMNRARGLRQEAIAEDEAEKNR